MASYEDWVSDQDDPNSPSSSLVFFEDGAKEVKSLTITLRTQTKPSWSFIYNFGKATTTSIEDVDMNKLKTLSETATPSKDYVEKIVNRIRKIKKLL